MDRDNGGMDMFPSLGMPELILILVIALVVFGPKQLPEVGKALGKTINSIRNASMSGLADTPEKEERVNEKEVKEGEQEAPAQQAAATEAARPLTGQSEQ